AFLPSQGPGFSPAAKDMHILWQGQLPGDLRDCVMIAAYDEYVDSRAMQPAHLACQKTRRLHRSLVAIIKIAGEKQRIDALLQAEIDNGLQYLPRRIADQSGNFRIAKGKGAQ